MMKSAFASNKVFYMIAYSSAHRSLNAEICAGYGLGNMAIDECYSLVHEGLHCCLIHLIKKKRGPAVRRFIEFVCMKDKEAVRMVRGFPSPNSHGGETRDELFSDPLFKLMIQHMVEKRDGFTSWVLKKKGTGILATYLKRESVDGGSVSGEGCGIYVLRVDNNPKPFFYVGKSEDITRRIQQHLNGEGAVCITGEQFTRVKPMTTGIFTHECV
jgi:hypothetical protein